jgi:hypothetical protein
MRTQPHLYGSKRDAGPLAQRLEQRTHNPLVVGSNPTGPTNSHMSKLNLVASLLSDRPRCRLRISHTQRKFDNR